MDENRRKAAANIEMRRDFIKQNQRGHAVRGFLDKTGVSEDKADEEGLLFASRAHLRRCAFRSMNNLDVASVGTDQGAPGGAVPVAHARQKLAISIAHIALVHRGGLPFEMALQRQPRPREHRVGIAVALLQDFAGEAFGRAPAGGGYARRCFRHLRLDRVQKLRRAQRLQRLVSLPHRPIEDGSRASIRRLQAEDKPVQKTAAVAGGSGKKTIHRGREPYHPHRRQRAGALRHSVIDLHDAGGAGAHDPVRRRLNAGPNLDVFARDRDACGNRPATGASASPEIGEGQRP